MGFGKRMNDNDKNAVGAIVLLAALMLSSTAARAQAVPTPQDTARTIPGLVIATPTPVPTPAPTRVPVPIGPVLGLPVLIPTPTPSATPAAAPIARPTARTRSAPTPAKEPPPKTPDAAPSPTPTASPSAAPVPTPILTPGPEPSAAVPPPPAQQDFGLLPWLAMGAALLLGLAGWAWWRRRSTAVADEWAQDGILPDPSAPPPPVAPVRPTGPRATIAVALRPIRAGLNMLSATVEAEVVVTNTGAAAATQVSVHATLLSAHAAQDADLAAAFAAPAGRPAAPPFALAPGEERRVRIVAALPRESVRSMEAGGRSMFVPLLAIDVRYAADAAGTPARTGQAFVVGVERVDSAKLAPFWLDGPTRMHDRIAARAHGGVVEG